MNGRARIGCGLLAGIGGLPAGAVGGDGDRLRPARQRRHRDERAPRRPGRPRLEPDRRLPPDPVHRPRRDDGQSRSATPTTSPAVAAPAPEHARHGRLPAEGEPVRRGLGADRPARLERQRRQEPRDRRERVHRRDDLQRQQEGVRQRPHDPRLPARADPGRRTGPSSSASPTSDPADTDGIHYHVAGPRQLRSGLERQSLHAVRPAARRRRPAAPAGTWATSTSTASRSPGTRR